MDVVAFGLLNEALGRGSPALTGVLTVQTWLRWRCSSWGTAEQKEHLASSPGQRGDDRGVCADGAGAGSALQSLVTEFTQHPAVSFERHQEVDQLRPIRRAVPRFRDAGGRSWLASCRETRPSARRADLRSDGVPAAGLGELHFRDVEVPSANVVGKPGFALSHVAPVACTTADQHGVLRPRLLRGCFEESLAHATARKIGDKTVGELG